MGLIYEKEGDLLKAKELFDKASNISKDDEVFIKNLKRVDLEIEKNKKTEKELRAALEDYRNESPYVQMKVLEFSRNRNAQGFIICSYRQAPQFLKMISTKAAEFLPNIISKKYFIKVEDHGFKTQSNVYKLNPYLESEIETAEKQLKIEDGLMQICNRLNVENLGQVGYDQDFLNELSKINSAELKAMLERDLRENAIALILGQNKSSLVLSGSIIEAILTDRILARNISKYKIDNKSKKVLNMDLNELLKVAELEKIIDENMTHLAHGVRGYRNLIHPGVENRKNSIQVDTPNAQLAWGIVKKLIKEVS